MTPLKVLFIQANPAWEAIASVHAQIVKHFDPAEVEAHVACTTDPPPPGKQSPLPRFRKLEGIHLVELSYGPSVNGITKMRGLALVRRAPWAPLALVRLVRYIRTHGIQVIHAGQKPRDAIFAVLLARLSGIKCQIHLHLKFDTWANKAVRWSLRNADGVVCVSHFVAESLRSRGYEEQAIEVVHNGIDTSEWNPDTDGSPVRREWGVAEGTLLLGIVGRLTAWKGQKELISALPAVRKAFPNVRVWIVGEHDPWADPDKDRTPQALKAHAEKLGVADAVQFLGHRKDVQAVLAALDVFVFPSWEEGFGLAFLEAMAMRKPVVGWANGAAPEIVPDSAGRLVEPKNLEALAQAIIELGSDKALRERMGAAGRAHAEKAFTFSRCAEGMARVYANTLARPRRTLRFS